LSILFKNPQNISKAKIINPTNFFNIFPHQSLKTVVSPHYDDLAFSLGGTITSFSRYNMEIDDLIVFSRTTYTKDNPGHSGGSKIEKNVSTQRLLEEKNMTNLLKNIKISTMGLTDSPTRGVKNIVSLENEEKHQSLPDLEKILLPILKSKIEQGEQLFFPLAICGHIDHILVRHLAEKLLSTNISFKSYPQIIFYEDLPYAVLATKKDQEQTDKIIKKLNLEPLLVPINYKYKLKLIKSYPSQITILTAYLIISWSHNLKRIYQNNNCLERIYIPKKSLKL